MALTGNTGTIDLGNARVDVINGAASVTDLELTFRMDDTTSATYTYYGEAVPGSATSAASWRISRKTNADNTIVYADGDSDFDNVWDDRATLSYS